MEWEKGAAENGEEEEEQQCVEDTCTWRGLVIGGLGGCRAMSEDVDMETGEETIEMVVDSGCRRTLAKPKAFQKMKVKKTEHVGLNFRAANGAHIPSQGETIIEGRDASGAKLKVVAQFAEVTKSLASVMGMVDHGH